VFFYLLAFIMPNTYARHWSGSRQPAMYAHRVRRRRWSKVMPPKLKPRLVYPPPPVPTALRGVPNPKSPWRRETPPQRHGYQHPYKKSALNFFFFSFSLFLFSPISPFPFSFHRTFTPQDIPQGGDHTLLKNVARVAPENGRRHALAHHWTWTGRGGITVFVLCLSRS